jgi:isochorismate synthase
MALAGTQLFTGEKDITWGAKEVREQQIVTDHIVNELSGIPIKVGSPYTKKAGNLLHLCTDIHGKLSGDDHLSTLIEKLHPTAAVCGLPKKEAQEFILTHEGYDRSFYTGFLGELNHPNPGSADVTTDDKSTLETNLYVNLRCMQLIPEPKPAAVLYIGGGITQASQPELEWEETVEKSKVMKRVLFD